MKILSFGELREQMNGLGRAGVPFVWGVDYARERCFVLEEPFTEGEILWEVRGVGNKVAAGVVTTGEVAPEEAMAGEGAAEVVPELRIARRVEYGEYEGMFATLRAGLLRGDSFLANLTVPTEVELRGTLRDVFRHSSAPFKLLIGDEFVCFSPEPFVTIREGMISTFPMKGTIDASLPEAERKLMEDYKETCEHFTIVDLMRNDINMVAEEVTVPRLRYVETIATAKGSILQTSSEVRGRIPAGKERDFGDIILPLLPAGSITGAPKPATVELIARSEIAPRGWYTGVFGYFDGAAMQSAVMIRCIQRGADGKLYFHSGGGVTVNSDCRDEYEEVLTKVYLTK